MRLFPTILALCVTGLALGGCADSSESKTTQSVPASTAADTAADTPTDPATPEPDPAISNKTSHSATDGDWLHTDGNRIVDSEGNPVWLTGANWFGFNTEERVFHGLWTANITETTKAMAEHGLNVVRVPFSAELLLEWRDGKTATPNVNVNTNPELANKNNLEVFDYWLDLCEQYGLKVIVDVHSAEADNAGHMHNLWFTDRITTADTLDAWEWFAGRYRDNDTIVGADLKNEPHGAVGEPDRAKWDDSADPENFKHYAEQAAARILAKNPHLLILAEGIQVYPAKGKSWTSTNPSDFSNSWWGGNLRAVQDHPLDLGKYQSQVVYSPHDYGPLVSPQPWFEGNWSRATLERDVWGPDWLYIHKDNIAPLLIGEWGGFLDGGPNEKWMVALRDTIVAERLNHTFWALNPNSGDTGGLLTDDWVTWDQKKYALLKPALWQVDGKFVSLDHEVKLGGDGSATGISLAEALG